MRTTRSVVVFAHPFRIAAEGETFPPGRYEVETDEAAFEGNGPTVYIRIATLLFVTTGTSTSVHTVVPEMLDKALADDVARTAGGAAYDPHVAKRGTRR